MAAKKKALPEIKVSAPEYQPLVDQVKKALDLRAQIAALSTEETEAKKGIADQAKAIREAEEAKGNYIGLVRVTDEDQSPGQIQFKIAGQCAVAVEDLPALDTFFGSARVMLFEKDVAIESILDPLALIKEIQDRGQDPLDFLDIKVKKGLDRALADSPNVVKVEAYLPKEGFLATINEIANTFTDSAKEWVKNYLAKVLSTAVNLGCK